MMKRHTYTARIKSNGGFLLLNSFTTVTIDQHDDEKKIQL